MTVQKGNIDKAFWMTATRNGHCEGCDAPIEEDDRIVWNPTDKYALCAACGEEEAGEDPNS